MSFKSINWLLFGANGKNGIIFINLPQFYSISKEELKAENGVRV